MQNKKVQELQTERLLERVLQELQTKLVSVRAWDHCIVLGDLMLFCIILCKLARGSLRILILGYETIGLVVSNPML